MIGVSVASLAIVLLVSIGLGVQKDITGQVEDLGAGILIVVPGKVNFGTFNPNIGGQSFLSDEAAADVAKVDGVKSVARWTFAGGGIEAGEKESYPIIIATTPNWFQIKPNDMASGQPFVGNSDECLLGSVAAIDLFGTVEATGKSVNINGREYTVSGVIEDSKAESSPFSMFSMANVAYIPLEAVRQSQANTQIDRIIIQVDPAREPEALVESVNKALAKTLTELQFSVLTQEDLLGLIYQVLGILATLVIGLTSIALVVGGLGIMTVMLMSVGERTAEIGVRMAVGADKKAIFRHFLAEAATIGVIGVTLGLIAGLIVNEILRNTTSIKPLVTPGTIILTVAVGLGLGCVFGIVPAAKAARLHPVEALRRE